MNTDESVINILMVDDRPENLLALEAIIERDDYRLIKASSGEEALKCLLKYDFAVILLDVQMPGIDGFATAKIIKAREKTKNIPIIFITANYMDSNHIFTGYSVGAIDYILKPFDPIVLKAKVEGFVDLYKLNQKLLRQSEALAEKSKEVERANAELRVSEALANVISGTSIDSMLVMDGRGMILRANPAVETMFGYSETEMVGDTVFSLFPDESSRKIVASALEAVARMDLAPSIEPHAEMVATRKEGSAFPAEVQFGSRYVSDRCIVACTIRDVTKKKRDQETIAHMAYHDGLTQLPNRRRFNERLAEALHAAKRSAGNLSMMYLDMDRFKYVNDSLGHAIGDKLLKEVADRLAGCMRAGDFAARIGGDEFSVLLPDTNRETALECAERILEAFQKPIHLDQYELFVTTSIGISVFPYDGDDAQQLMKNADAALYRAKEQGKNRYKVFHTGMNLSSYRNFMLQNELRKAIEREELRLVYQPRIDVKTGAVTSAEALLRWKHPNWGTVLPSEFIPLAEESGQMAELGEWVLRTASKQSVDWQRAGIAPIRVAVNFSAHQFLHRDAGERIRRILEQNELRPELLEIEITETALMGNEESVTRTLRQLKSAGIAVSIDDFGTGYSSLNYLRRFPVDSIKIDKSFVQDLCKSASDSTPFVQAIVSLAQSLRMTVVAEGVETEGQLSKLRALHCDEFQGYLFCPPVEAADFEAFLVRSQAPKTDKTDGTNDPAVAQERLHVVRDEPSESQNQEILNRALLHTKETYSISPREFDVFHLMVNGFNNKEISDKLFISEHTVKNHITHIFQKLNVNDRVQAMAKIYQTCIDEGKAVRANRKSG
ncbi:EAL domain-containing protein [Paenibacillus antri]|uniref:EAL domain-containing protein n=1 Tax=Paenibacillus antri TaxID=2582848 RepID=A0A5R9GKB9_9BACL|nr:EAL domain-containing protein [Paenibacillus antri]TLS52105.1 EAL domain-containing protein [Paenibacillus antri]